MTATDYRDLADRRLAQLAAIARIGAEPPDAVLAIIAGGELPPRAGSTDTSTCYHESVNEFRRVLVGATADWHKRREGYFAEMGALRDKGETPDLTLLDAYAGTMMAGSYAYTLAAILGHAEKEWGPQTARRLASIADDILENGDFDDLNADVKPGTPPLPPTARELEIAGQLRLEVAHTPDDQQSPGGAQ